MKKHLNLMIPQWQGGGQDLSTYHGAYAFVSNYMSHVPVHKMTGSKKDISPIEHNILGYRDILSQLEATTQVLANEFPASVFTIGGGCDADIPCIAYLNKMYKDMALVYIDAHGDLNTPASSGSHLFYGMSLRALTGESDPAILRVLNTKIDTHRLILCGGRNLDPEEERFIDENRVSLFSVEELEKNPHIVSHALTTIMAETVYVHIDLDVLDPKEFSLTPLHEPNGLSRRTLLRILEDVSSHFYIVGLGVLEYGGTKKDRDDTFIKEITAIGTALE